MKNALFLFAVATVGVAAVYAGSRLRGKITDATVDSRLAEFGADADARWRPFFAKAGAVYPAKSCTLVAIKDAKVLRVYAPDAAGKLRFVREMPILAASGVAGPKLREGDRQVPEGVYAVESLNPRSLYHVALRVNYPNAEDRAFAKAEGRTKPGGDIMIHGKAASIGCLAMGDDGAEDLFALAARAGTKNVALIFAPTDFKTNPGFAPPAGSPAWLPARYEKLKVAMAALP